MVLTVALAAAGCTGSDSDGIGRTSEETPDATGSAGPPANDAASICASHFDDVSHAQLSKVGAVRQLGPQLVSPPPGPLDAYADDEPIAVCLVPDGPGRYDVVAVVLVDGATYVRWTQNLDDGFYWPL